MDEFKQPQLGQTIVSLRQEKKLTQEELVERCNLNVRTLQRIEAGEVTPRDFTIRAIFQALEYEFAEFRENAKRRKMTRYLHWAWIGGLVYFLIGFLEVYLEFWRFDEPPTSFPLLYITTKLVVLGSFVFFMYGFVQIGLHHLNAVIRIAAWLMIGSLAVIEIFDMLSMFSDMTEMEIMYTRGVEAVAFGGIDIVFGIGLIQLRKELGTSALAAGIFEILAGLFFLTFILAFVGLFLLIPAIILEVVVLYKVYDKLSQSA